MFPRAAARRIVLDLAWAAGAREELRSRPSLEGRVGVEGVAPTDGRDGR
jgi:hypothetical protein